MKHPIEIDGATLLYEKTTAGLKIYAGKRAINKLDLKYDLGIYNWQEIAHNYGLPIDPLKICFKIIRSNKADHDRVELHPVTNNCYGVAMSDGLVTDFWPIELYNKIKRKIYNIKE